MKLIGQSFIYLSARLLSGIIGLGTTVTLTHILIPSDYGVYGLVMTIMMFISNTSFDGLGLSFARFGVGCRNNQSITSTIVIGLVAVVALNVAIMGVLSLTGAIPSKMLNIFWVSLLLACIYSLFELSARYEMANFSPLRYLTMNSVRTVAVFILSTLLAWTSGSPFGALIGTGIGMLIGTLFGTLPIRTTRLKDFDPAFARTCLVFGIPLIASLFFEGLSITGVRWLVQARGSLDGLGHFTVAYMIVQNSLILIAAGVGGAGFQFAVKSYQTEDAETWRKQMADIAILLVAIVAPASLGMALTAKGLAHALMPASYSRSFAELLPWMAFASFIASFRWFYLDQAFQLAKTPQRQLVIAISTAIFANALALFLIPTLGALGASIAYAAAMLISLPISYSTGRRVCKLPIPVSDFAKIAACCGVMTLAIMLLPDRTDIPTVLAKILIGATAYAASVIASDLMGVRRILRDIWTKGDFGKLKQFRQSD